MNLLCFRVEMFYWKVVSDLKILIEKNADEGLPRVKLSPDRVRMNKILNIVSQIINIRDLM